MARTAFLATADGIRLEAEVGPMPAATPRGAAVVCHPHPMHGGDMRSPVVDALARASRDAGHVPLRFNFRGTGRSGGAHGGGVAEVADVEAAVAHARALVPGGRLAVMGYSFGAAVVTRWLESGGRADAAVLVALPEGSGEAAFDGVPTMLVVGDLDTISPPREAERLARVRAWRLSVLEGEDHLLLTGLGALERAVRAFLQENAP